MPRYGERSPPAEREPEPRVEDALVQHLVQASPLAEGGQVVVLALSLVFLTGVLPTRGLAVGAGAILLLALGRGLLRWRRQRETIGVPRFLAAYRVTLGLSGLAWGIGAVAAALRLPPERSHLVLVVVCGLAAASVATLTADRTAFLLFLLGLIGPIPVALLLTTPSLERRIAAALIAVFATTLVIYQHRAHALLTEHAETLSRVVRSERAAVQDRSSLNAVLAGAPVGIALLDGQGRVRLVNASFNLLFGYRQDESEGRLLRDLVIPAGGAAQAVADAGPLAPETVTERVEARHRDGTVIPVRVSRTGIPGVGVLTIWEDIRGQLLADAAVRDSEERFRTLADSAPIGIFLLDAHARCVYSNPLWTTLTGLTPAQALEDEWLRAIHGDDREAVFGEWSACIAQGRTFDREFRFVRRDGELRRVHAKAAPVRSPDGRIKSWVGTHEDVTERHRAAAALLQAERHFRDIVESASDLIFEIDHAGRWSYLNQAAETIYGRHRRRLLGRPFAEVVLPGLVDREMAAFADVLHGRELRDHETMHLGRDGQVRRLSFAIKPLLDQSGAVVGAHGIARDVSARAEVEQALREARAAAERASRSRAAFLANMSHEIRTPLNGILGLTELLLARAPEGVDRRTLELLRSSGGTLLALVNDVLDLSKIEADRLELEAIPIDLRSLLSGLEQLFHHKAREKDIALDHEVAADVPPFVRADPTRLKQVLSNLIGNALKFTEKGSVRVRVSRAAPPVAAPAGDDPGAAGAQGDGAASARDAAGVEPGEVAVPQPGPVAGPLVHIEFRVEDTGIGIPAANLASIFDAFTQADATVTRRYGGTGLGLAISRRICRHMGGDLTVTSQPGEGSTFAFTLPLPLAEVGPAEHKGPAEMAPTRHRLRVLLAEDNEVNKIVAVAMLERRGHAVEVAANGVEAVRMAGAGLFDLVLMDIQMPEMDGLAATRAIRALPGGATLPIVALTAHALPSERDRCLAEGMTDYLSKPFSPEDLCAVVERWGGRAAPTPAPQPG